MTDEDWTKLVESRSGCIDFSEVDLEKEIEYNPAYLMGKMIIDSQYGTDWDTSGPVPVDKETRLSEGEIRGIREIFHSLNDEESIRFDFNLTQKQLDSILNGEIAPYIGGPLKLAPLSGVNPHSSAYNPTQKKFTKGVIAYAKEILSFESFEIFCNFNGMTIKEGLDISKDAEEINERLARKRYSAAFIRHFKGERLERALATYKRK